jgi:hypothetical protein
MATIRAQNRALRAQVAQLEAAAAAAGAVNGWRTVRTVQAGPTGEAWTWAPVVDRGEAMQVPVLAFIRNQLAGGMASMTLERVRVAPDGTETDLPAGWLDDPDPAATIPLSVFWAWVVDDLFFAGVSTLVVLSRYVDGFPASLRRILPGQLSYDPTTLAYGMQPTVPPAYLGQQIDPADLVVIAGPHEGIVNYGSGVIRAALDLEAAAAQSAASPVPNMELHQSAGEALNTAGALALVDDWAAARRRGSTAYTPPNIETKVLGFSAADQQLVEARQYMATQLARLAGVNPVLVSAAMGSSSSYVYTNQQDYRQAFLDDVLDAYLRAIEGRLSAPDVTPRGQLVRFDRDQFTRITPMQRAQVMVGALKSLATPEQVAQVADALGVDLQEAPA